MDTDITVNLDSQTSVLEERVWAVDGAGSDYLYPSIEDVANLPWSLKEDIHRVRVTYPTGTLFFVVVPEDPREPPANIHEAVPFLRFVDALRVAKTSEHRPDGTIFAVTPIATYADYKSTVGNVAPVIVYQGKNWSPGTQPGSKVTINLI